jgi:hypothetical protein
MRLESILLTSGNHYLFVTPKLKLKMDSTEYLNGSLPI